MSEIKFIVRQMNGIIRGELTLCEESSKLYRSRSHNEQLNTRLELNVVASEHFNTDCYVSEVVRPVAVESEPQNG